MDKGLAMLDMPWLDRVPDVTLANALAFANRLYWALSVEEGAGRWVVYGGEKVILRTDSRDVVDAFLYAFGLAYGAIPREVFERMEADIKQLVDPLDEGPTGVA